MRVTTETMVMRSLERLQTRAQAYERAQSALGTGKRLTAASDDPVGARRGLSLRSAVRAREQEVRNANDAVGRLDVADQQLQQVMARVQRARELATRGATDVSTAERQALAAEVREIRDEIEAIANTRHLNRPLFGGFHDGAAVAWDADADGGAGAWIANGFDPVDGGDVISRRVGDDEVVRVNVTAGEWLGMDGAAGTDLLSRLDRLTTQLEQGTAGQVSGMVAELDDAMLRVGDSLSVIGASTNRVESARARADGMIHMLKAEMSQIEDIDVAEGMMELHTQQVAYEAALQALSKALPPTLAAFLR